MPVTTNLGAAAADHATMLAHLITIGEALNADFVLENAEVGHLTTVVGVGEAFAERMRELGIDSLQQLAEAGPETIDALEALPGITRADAVDWSEQAKVLVRDATRAAIDAETYHSGVVDRIGRPIEQPVPEPGQDPADAEGISTLIVGDGGTARPVSFNVFGAPTGHEASQTLSEALRAYVASSDGNPRVPGLSHQQLVTLRVVRDATNGGMELSTEQLGQLNRALRSSGVTLRRESDTPVNRSDYQSYAALVDDDAYGVVGYDDVDLLGARGAAGYTNAHVPPGGALYDHIDPTRNMPGAAAYDASGELLDTEDAQFSSETMLLRTPGARVDGEGFSSARPHDEPEGPPAVADGSADESPGPDEGTGRSTEEGEGSEEEASEVEDEEDEGEAPAVEEDE